MDVAILQRDAIRSWVGRNVELYHLIDGRERGDQLADIGVGLGLSGCDREFRGLPRSACEVVRAGTWSRSCGRQLVGRGNGLG